MEDNMSKVCRAIGYIVVILGAIGTFSLFCMGASYGEGETALLWLLAGGLSTAMLGAIFFGMATIIDKIDEVKRMLNGDEEDDEELPEL